jgi:outer membrane protein TolC
MKKNNLITTFILFFCFPFNLFALDFIEQINSLKTKSFESAPELKIARANYSQINAENYEALSRHTPQAALMFKQDHDVLNNINPVLKTLGVVPPDHSWAINYSWSLFNYGVIQSTLKKRAENLKAELTLSNKEKEYSVTFSTDILNFLLAKYKTLAVLNSLKKSETSKKEANLGFTLGHKTKIDVLRAEANFISLASKKTKYLDEVEEAKNTFLEFTGLEQESINFLAQLTEEEIIDLINKLSQTAMLKDSNQVNSNGPLISMIMADEKINSHSINLITKDEWPELKLQGAYNNSGTSFNESFNNPTRSHILSVVLTIPIWGGGSLISTNFAQYYSKKQLEYSLQRDRLQLKNNFEITFQKIKTLETLISSLSINVSQFEELSKLTTQSYQLGKSSIFELLDVQDNLLDSKISLAQNKIQLYTLTQNYLWQTGSL